MEKTKQKKDDIAIANEQLQNEEIAKEQILNAVSEEVMGKQNTQQVANEFSVQDVMLLVNENEVLKNILVDMLMQQELIELKKEDKTISSFDDIDLTSYLKLRNENIPVKVAYSAINQMKNLQPSTGDIKQANNFEKPDRFKAMSRDEFLTEVQKALRGELM